jgi:hypothetical protein
VDREGEVALLGAFAGIPPDAQPACSKVVLNSVPHSLNKKWGS